MKKVFLIILISFSGIYLKAQTNIDSLWGVWENEEQHDTVRFLALNKFRLEVFSKPNLDSALILVDLELQFAQKKDLKMFVDRTLNSKGIILRNLGEIKKSFAIHKQVLASAKKQRHYDNIGDSYFNLNELYKLNGNKKGLQKFFSEELEYVSSINRGEIFIDLCNYLFKSYSLPDNRKSIDSLYEIGITQVQKFNNSKTEADFLILQSQVPGVDGEEKIAWRQKALKIQRKMGDIPALANNLEWIGFLEGANGNNELSITAYKEAIVVHKKANDYKKVIRMLLILQNIYANKNHLLNSSNCFIEAKEIATKQNDTSILSSILTREGIFYRRRSVFVKSVELLQQSLDLALKLNDKVKIYNVHSALGTLYEEDLQDYDKALYHYLETLKIAKKDKDNGYLALAFINVASISIYQENYELALDYLNQARIPAFESKWTVDYYYTRFGLYYEKQKEYNKALENYKKGIEYPLYQAVEAKYQRALSYADMGRVYMLLKDYTKAASACKEGFDYAVNLKYLTGQKVNCNCLYAAYKKQGRKAEAFDYLEKLGVINDSLSIKETEKQLQNIAFAKQLQTDSLVKVEEARLVQETHAEEMHQEEKTRNYFAGGGIILFLLAGGLFARIRYIRKSKATLQVEKDRSENLLLNILPEEIAQELKEKGKADARDFDMVSIIFTDFKGFTEQSAKLSAAALVNEINTCFEAFDGIIEKYGIEKIKTIGDSYMSAGGLPVPTDDSTKNTVLAALEMQAFIGKRKAEMDASGKLAFVMRVGIHTGPVVAGIVGVKKFQYDIWGDTVNTASRMETSGAVGKVNVSKATYELLKEDPYFVFETRGKIDVKGKGGMEMYFVSSKTEKK